MDGWQCPACGTSNDRYTYQCRQCRQPRPSESDSHTPAAAPRQQVDLPTPDSPAPGRFVVFEPADLVAKCTVCGRYPARQFRFKGNQGMLFMRRIFGFEGILCRTCAETTYRNIQSRNLSWGWYGAVSFCATISYGLSNATNYRQGRRELPEPVPSSSIDDAKLRVQPIWKTLLVRLPVILVIFVVIGVVIWAIYK